MTTMRKKECKNYQRENQSRESTSVASSTKVTQSNNMMNVTRLPSAVDKKNDIMEIPRFPVLGGISNNIIESSKVPTALRITNSIILDASNLSPIFGRKRKDIIEGDIMETTQV